MTNWSKVSEYRPEDEACYFCSELTDNYCDGCGAFICGFCEEITWEDLNDYHEAEEHQRDIGE